MRIAKGSMEISQSSLEIGNRAWLKLEVKVRDPIQWTDDGFTSGFSFTATNLGATPALGTNFWYEVHSGGNINSAVVEFVNSMQNMRTVTTPQNVFPMDHALDGFAHHGQVPEIDPGVLKEGVMYPCVVACVRYRTIFDASDAPMRLTVRVYTLSNNSGSISKADCPIIPGALSLADHWEHAGYIS
jgi:hypothetical protein